MKPIASLLMLFLLLGTTFMSPALAADTVENVETVAVEEASEMLCKTSTAEEIAMGMGFNFQTDKYEYLPGETIILEGSITTYTTYYGNANDATIVAQIRNPDGSLTVVNLQVEGCSAEACPAEPNRCGPCYGKASCDYRARYTIPQGISGPISIRAVAKLNGEKITRNTDVFVLPPIPNGEAKIHLSEGWNLVNLPGTGHIIPEPSMGQEPIVFVYLPGQQRYVTLEEFEQIYGNSEEYLSRHSFWVYSYQETTLHYNGEFASYSGIEVFRGWNFLPTTRDMEGRTIEQVQGTARIQRAYRWDADSQEWERFATNELMTEDDLFYGVLVWSSNHGHLFVVLDDSEPPEFPE